MRMSTPRRLDAQSVASVDPLTGNLAPTFAWTSMDDSASIVSSGKVQAYRREHFPMPWQRVCATTASEAEATLPVIQLR